MAPAYGSPNLLGDPYMMVVGTAAAVVLNLSPKQAAAVLGTAAKMGFTAPFLVSLPGFGPGVLAGDLARPRRTRRSRTHRSTGARPTLRAAPASASWRPCGRL
ncbi:hypothetical protein [Kutzneria buriramensis]|uniref:hypothetical protein n=1 Tax=Kutzneria buriramensis TaxID=1045776 RepID=UPI0011C167D2|nr:hypothetical protein [Kutzneria buriramensis]